MSGNETIKQAVMANLGISLVSLHTIGNEITNNQIAILDIKDTPIIRTWYIVTPNNRDATQATEAFRQFIVNKGEGILNSIFNAPQLSA